MNQYNYIEIFCDNVKLLRKTHGLRKKDMAKRLGICLKSLNKIEQGEMPHISMDVFDNIEREFGINIAKMLKPLDNYSIDQ